MKSRLPDIPEGANIFTAEEIKSIGSAVPK